ncbi:polysaccharide lyase family 7 protein [Pseudonocardia sp. Cha107L01]|uniref:polysaccharide lyase family 7 protein n=1 Tax=Pseudonocardia sp. Cha107L01 TaxID=3457576 RepID=UPI00403EF1DC
MKRQGLPSKLSVLRDRRWVAIAMVLGVLLCGGLWITLAHSGGGASESQTAAPATPASPPPLPPPGIALSGWKLSLPEANDKGDAASIEPAAFKEPWMTALPDGGLMFWAPTSGATTKNSTHPRTELQSLHYFSAGTGVHTLAASLTLLQLPQDGGGIILGQIHGAGPISSVPYVMLRVQDNKLRVVVKQVGKGKKLINYPLLDNVGLNNQLDYTITDLGNGSMTFSATYNGQTRQSTAPVPTKFLGKTVRFQAGDYQQANSSSGPQDGGRVVFHRLAQQSTNP